MVTKSAAPISDPPSHKPDGKVATVRKPVRTLAGNTQPADDAARKSTIALYESAIKLMQSGRYDKAHEAFTRMLEGSPGDLADRIRMYISACVAQIHKGTTTFQSHEERYDYAISLLNHGHYEDAREHFKAILLEDGSADYAFYGLALLSGMTGDADECLDNLARAISLNSHYRLQARLDSDFEPVAEDPRFTELLYPET
jgi:tetratricopeptide (TPR) repeat protein